MIYYRLGEEELYGLARDPHEWRDLVRDNEHAAIKARLARRLEAELANEARPGR